MDAGGDLCALLEADAIGALADELPDPGADDECERADQRARRDEAERRAAAAEEDADAGDEQDDAWYGEPPAGPDRPAAQENRREPGDDQADADHGRHRQPDREQQQGGRRGDEGAPIATRPSA